MMRTECGLGADRADEGYVKSLVKSAAEHCSSEEVDLPMRVIFEAIEETICLRNVLSGNAFSQKTGLGGRQLLFVRMKALAHDPKALQHKPSDWTPKEETFNYSNQKTRNAI